ncbi:pyridoxal-dependent decarboxylase [Janthinobacterium fluminis]|uniref:Pyridoxal-dependent decarboxylase n=1 Tax=Janthinobacterium fluminis TaxID=2987524 RepID=A0ABT5K347_9BURK|nr:pyridoxal-dependent decarboxylase [Janthinobacterium fluminis]MDC8759105.1 pyridoxal-dependent decarboxylase [Janthinobacterium fluminis]
MSELFTDELLRRHFDVDGLGLSPAVLETALGMMREWIGARRGHPYPLAAYGQLKRDWSGAALPLDGMDAGALLAELERDVFAHTAQLNHPKYIGHMTQALPWMAVLAEAFIATLNQNQVKIETAYAATLVENKVLGWLHQRVYACDEAFYRDSFADGERPIGNMVGGGTMGNLTALAVAVERQLPGARKAGLFAVLQQSGHAGVAVLGSARTHYSVKKALATLGLGEDAMCLIPVDADNRMDVAALRRTVAELKARRVKILALVGIAGTTETGSIDPLPELAEICRREQIWFHVDAAWGGALLLADRYKPLFRGIELADSVVIDGHKLLWVTMAQSMVLFRDAASLDALKHNANYIIRAGSGDLGQTSLEGSRRFDALKLWMSFKLFGLRGYGALLGRAGALTESMRGLIAADGDFELTSASQTFILTYRYVPAAVQASLRALLAAGRHAEVAALNGQMNDLNAALQTAQKEGGKSFVSRTVLESTAYGGEIVVLRIILTNVTTTQQHLREILDEQRQLGAGLWAGTEAI